MKEKLSNNSIAGSVHFLEDATGPVLYNLTNDYLFRAVFQSSEKALRGLVCSLLHLKQEEVHKLIISNPIDLGKSIYDKEIILDLKLELNDYSKINIEMQVNNEKNWTERSLVYTCRTFGSINKGEGYINVKPVIHIGFLDFELFPANPEFYSTYQLLNVKNCNKYSDKMTVSVVNLNRIDLATEEDKAYGIDYWARLFKSTTWEEIKVLAERHSGILEAANAMYDFTSDEIVREHCEMREEYLRRERTKELEREALERDIEASKVELKDLQEEKRVVEEELKGTKEELQGTKKELQNTKDKLQEAESEYNRRILEKDSEIARLCAEIEKLKKY